MGFLDIIGLAPRPTLPDLSCPECGHGEFVPVRDIVRIDAAGARRTVGSVVRCARCVSEFAATASGVYTPKPQPPMPSGETDRRRPPADRLLADSDLPYEGRRKR